MLNQKQSFPESVASFFKGFGQIMLQSNPWTGICFFAGICYGSLMMGIAVAIAVIVGTFTALLLKYNKDEINNGLYGFSAALVGVALICFFQPTITIWIAVLIGSALATIVQHFFIIKKIPVFTFPFILVTWLFLIIAHYCPALVSPQPEAAAIHTNNYLALFSRGFGQVIFQDNILSGMFFIIGIFISRPIAAIYAIVGIVLSGALAFLLKESVNDIYLGLLSYNAVLCAITFSGTKAVNLLMALVAIVFSTLIMIQMRHWHLNIPALTFPFVLATWLTLIIQTVKHRVQSKLDLKKI